MSRLEKLRGDLAKANVTFENAKKRKAMLERKVDEEEQRGIRAEMNKKGVTQEEVIALIASAQKGNAQND